MPGIDAIFDLAEGALAAFDQVSGIPGEGAGRRPGAATAGEARRASPRDQARPAPGRPTPTTASRALARTVVSGAFRVDDVIDAETGRAVYVVTNGRDRAECNSREFAERVRASLA